MKIEVYFGVPGAGKTHILAKRVKELMDYNFKKIAVVSLTKATKRAFKIKADKFNLDISEDNIRTLHSFCFSKLKSLYEYDFLTIKQTQKWFRDRGFKYDVQEADDDILGIESNGVILHKLFDLARITWSGEVDFTKHLIGFINKYKTLILSTTINESKFIRLFNEFMEYQLQEKRLDFTSMLFIAVKEGIELEGGDILVVDEAQDFGALHWSIIKNWMKSFKRVLIAGDDDQTIYSFSGAEPRHLLEFAKEAKTITLRKSFRLTKEIADISNNFIALNQNRYSKNIEALKEGGNIYKIDYRQLSDLVSKITKKEVLILARTRKRAIELSNDLYSIPHKLDIAGKKDIPEGIKLLWRYRKGGELTEEQWLKILKDKSLLKILFKKLKERDTRDSLVRVFFKGNSYELSRLLRYNQKQIERWFSILDNKELWDKSNIRITTIHQSKGDEADIVIIDTQITDKIFKGMIEDKEAERRVWYVALTRAREAVIILENIQGINYNLKKEIYSTLRA